MPAGPRRFACARCTAVRRRCPCRTGRDPARKGAPDRYTAHPIRRRPPSRHPAATAPFRRTGPRADGVPGRPVVFRGSRPGLQRPRSARVPRESTRRPARAPTRPPRPPPPPPRSWHGPISGAAPRAPRSPRGVRQAVSCRRSGDRKSSAIPIVARKRRGASQSRVKITARRCNYPQRSDHQGAGSRLRHIVFRVICHEIGCRTVSRPLAEAEEDVADHHVGRHV